MDFIKSILLQDKSGFDGQAQRALSNSKGQRPLVDLQHFQALKVRKTKMSDFALSALIYFFMTTKGVAP